MSSLLWLDQTASMEHVLSALQKINNLIDFNHQIERQPAALKLMPVFWQAAVEASRYINGYCIDLVSVDDCGCVTLKYDNRKLIDSCVFTLSTKSSGTGQCCTSIIYKTTDEWKWYVSEINIDLSHYIEVCSKWQIPFSYVCCWRKLYFKKNCNRFPLSLQFTTIPN